MKTFSIHSRRQPRAFTLAEIMCSLMIFAMVATAGTYLAGAMNSAEGFFRAGTTSQSEVEFALGRMVENVRAATSVSSPASTATANKLTLSNISGSTVTYQVNSSGNLTETIGSTTNVLVHGATFSVKETTANAKAFNITLTAGTQEVISRSITVFARNL